MKEAIKVTVETLSSLLFGAFIFCMIYVFPAWVNGIIIGVPTIALCVYSIVEENRVNKLRKGQN